MELDLNLFYLVTRRHCAFKFPTFMILYGTLGLRSLVKNRTKKWWLFHRFVLTITWLDKCASFSSVQSFQLCLSLCKDMECSMPGFPIHHQLLEFTQAHVHRLGNANQPSHSVFPFFSCLQSFLTSGSFPMCQLFLSGGQIIGASASTLVFPVNIQD